MDFDTTIALNLQQAIERISSEYNILGISAAVLIPGNGTWSGTTGFSTMIPPDSIRPEMLFCIGSQTKSFISALILKLAEDGKLSLDDSVGLHLPSFPNISGAIRIRQLLNMTSGLFDYVNDSPGLWNSVLADPHRYWSPEELLTNFVGPPHEPPGILWRYCNTNYLLLAMIVRDVGDTTVSAQLHQRIFDPLAIHGTFFPVEDSLAGPIAHPWWDRTDYIIQVDTANQSSTYGAGGMYSTAEDMVRWTEALFGGSILSPQSQMELQTLIPTEAFSAGPLTLVGYGLGVFRDLLDGRPLWVFAGRQGIGYLAINAYDPLTGVSVGLMYNSDGPSSPFVQLNSGVVALLEETLPHVHDVIIENPYVTPGTGTVRLRARLINPHSQPLAATAYFEEDTAIVDSSIFYDDGSHYDSLSGDGIWGTEWSVPAVERTYDVGIATISMVDTSRYYRRRLGAFTTTGPVVVDSIASQRLTGKNVRVYLWFRNSGLVKSISSIRAILRTTSPLVKSFVVNNGYAGGLTPGQRTSTPAVYVFKIDTSLKDADIPFTADISSSTVVYWTPGFNVNVGGGITDVSPQPGILPAVHQLSQNFPNPFNPTTTIDYDLPTREHLTLTVFNILGQQVALLVNEVQEPGHKRVSFDASHLTSGIYTYRISAGSFTDVKKMLLLK